MKKSFNFWVAGIGVVGVTIIVVIAIVCNLTPASKPSSRAGLTPSRLETPGGEDEEGSDSEKEVEFDASKNESTTNPNVSSSSGSSSQPSSSSQVSSSQTPTATPTTAEQQPSQSTATPPSPTRTCVYTSLYGNKTPSQLASEDYYVKYLYDELEAAQATYDEAVRLYSKSTSEQFRNKILQAEFALSKARILYQREYDEAFARYNDMKSQCSS